MFQKARRTQRWYGSVHVENKEGSRYYYASCTRDEAEAARARDCLAHKIGGFLVYNFPDESFEEKWERIGERQRKQIKHSLEKT